ncbi:GNAT family N-acetyltransferase [Variovorax sp. RHLX14]|uniref:GNAT family N-acetyltransferase n=1 Tax=Variovorax sp. RHLX14 TaxID=1259731 RepID=UPI003F45EF44
MATGFRDSGPMPLTGDRVALLLIPERSAEIEAVRKIFLDYAETLGVDLGFQNFDDELAMLPGDYAAPRGTLFLALVRQEQSATSDPENGLMLRDGSIAQVAGCCALRPLDSADSPNSAEMKRLYVRPAFRGMGLGRQLADAILDAARHAGYSHVLLDTLDDMQAARTLYEELGFLEIPPYYHSPIASSHYLKADL